MILKKKQWALTMKKLPNKSQNLRFYKINKDKCILKITKEEQRKRELSSLTLVKC